MRTTPFVPLSLATKAYVPLVVMAVALPVPPVTVVAVPVVRSTVASVVDATSARCCATATPLIAPLPAAIVRTYDGTAGFETSICTRFGESPFAPERYPAARRRVP